MLTITIKGGELLNEDTNEIIKVKDQKITLEHSLVSLYKWESKWKKSFLYDGMSTVEETIDYIKCMTITQNIDPNIYYFINDKIISEVSKYIKDPMTATTFTEREGKGKAKKERTTAELIYYWMISLEIPFECQKWHLNKLLTLIRVCSIKNTPSKKMSRKDIHGQNNSLNAMRRAQLHSRG